MADLTLKQLRYFDAVARAAHFGRAAALCSISQPAISVQIKELEQTLGTALFERGAREVRLTQAGEDLITRARIILGAVEDFSDAARASGGQDLARLRLGIIPTIAPYLLPAIIADLGRQYPNLDLHVRETLTPKLLGELADGKIDAAILALPTSEPSLEEVPLFTEDFVLVRPIGEAGKPVPGGEDLRKMRLLLLEEGHCFRDQALAFCSAGTALPRDGLDGSSLTTLVQMVSAGIGVTLIPQMAVSVETPAAAVDVAAFPAPRPSRSIGMIWRKRNPLARQLGDVAAVIKRARKAAQRRDAPPCA
ncbi:hydrogen peroxide-inducible genes activator [Planktotalea arctica]|uniref:hydrogen peroxide-inducible genes activator n=1 Tax=Planktotalea arctica TaxID=1481893 RepID=UPI000A177E3F|nr:hydrogen peroxide-inducible genes activator [Planktotalea arctica]